MGTIIIAALCTVACCCASVYAFPTHPKSDFKCENRLRVEQINSPDYFTYLTITLNVPQLVNNTQNSENSAWRLELETDVPFQSIAGANLWIKHFPKEARAIIKNDEFIKLEGAAEIKFHILWMGSEGKGNAAAQNQQPTMIRFYWNDGPLCKYFLGAPTTSTSTPLGEEPSPTIKSRRRRNPEENTAQRRQTAQDRRWNLNQGKTYFLTTFEE